MSRVTADDIVIEVETSFLPHYSRPGSGHFTFAYTITISNVGETPVQLLTRHWEITDGDGDVQDVRGEGVVGEQPIIHPGRFFRYTSGATLATPIGYMRGEYTLVEHSDAPVDPQRVNAFEVPIPAFTLATPTALN